MHHPLTLAQIRHGHNLHHQTRPTREVLRSLPRARFGVVLLPGEACSFPLVEDVFDEVFPEGGVDAGGLRFVGARLDRDVLDDVSGIIWACLEVMYWDLRRGFSRRGSSCLSISDFSSSSRLSRRTRYSCSNSLVRSRSIAPRDR